MFQARAVAFNVAFIAWTVLLGLVGFVVRWSRRSAALSLARLWVRGTIRLLDRVGGVAILVGGREHLPPPGQPALIASEHRAAIDSLVWLALVEQPSYVMKQELRRLPLVGPLLEPAGMIPVDRAGGAAALRGMLRDAGRAIAAGRVLVIFPEGTRAEATGAVALQGGVVALASRVAAPVLSVATDSGRAWGAGLLLGSGSAEQHTRHPRGRRVIRIRISPPLPETSRSTTLRHAIETAWRDGDAALADRSGLWTKL